MMPFASTSSSLEPSILNAEPFDEIIRFIADWIHRKATGEANIEIEAKVGVLREKGSKARIFLPVVTETVLAADFNGARFESSMPLAQHRQFNTMLNQLLETYNKPDYPHARMGYRHLRVVDSFYDVGGTKVRVTRDAETNQVLQCVSKRRLDDLNIFCPNANADWRVSINVEEPAHEVPTGSEQYRRHKDRMQYTHQAFHLDLTQVKSSRPTGTDPPVHELEIEFAQPDELMRLAAARGDRSHPDCDGFDELVRVFVNNCRLMIRNVSAWD
ncbi:mRNA triphosphatase CET1, partial [Auricularia subglabra TFB-10046 SS5]